MEQLRRVGIFERYGIWDRARYPNMADCPYPIVNINDIYGLYVRILNFILSINPHYLARPLPTLDYRYYDPFGTGLLCLTFIEAAISLELILVHRR